MLLVKAIGAYTAAAQLMEQEVSFDTAYALVLLKNRLQPHMEFFAKSELDLAEQYGEAIDGRVVYDENGRFRFKSKEAGAEYNRRKVELGAIELQETWEVMHVPKPDRIKPIHLEALQDFLVFDKGESE